MEEIERLRLPIKGMLAGPFQDLRTEQRVKHRVANLRSVTYLGPRYGKEKEQFFSDIDVLIFPTRYDTETEGIVNIEAMSQGVPIIVFGVGCIPELVDHTCGKVISPTEPFTPGAVEQIKDWLGSAETFGAASRAAIFRFEELLKGSEKSWMSLVAELSRDDDSAMGKSKL
jgi:glycosyltransferase involved in cell wall biosynthesis